MYPLLAALILVTALGAPGAAVGEPRLVEAYPNPATMGDDGEFVSVWVPPGESFEGYELADEHARVPLPHDSINRNQSTLIDRLIPGSGHTFSTNATLTESLTDREVTEISDEIRLADRGDRITLRRNGSVVDRLTYDWAPEADVYHPTSETWEPLGATTLPPVEDRGGAVEAFVLPDEGERARALLADADERILLAGYTLSSDVVVEELSSAVERNVTVEVLVDGAPVGGMTGQAAASLDELERAGVSVEVIGGDRARYRFHHAKYAVVDDKALVTSENWKPAGTGGQSSRGWGVITGQPDIVEGLVRTFRADTGWQDSIPWHEYDDATLVDDEQAHRNFPAEFEAERFEVERTRLLLAPDNAEAEILDVIRGAERRIEIKQVQISDRNFEFLQAVLAAAKRGVDVRILLSGEWYVEEENRQLAAWLEEQAEAENLPLQVRIAEPDGQFEKIHAKGMIVDQRQVLLGSINWNNNSVRNNREVALLLDGESVADYYGDVFQADWERDDGTPGFSIGLAAVVVVLSLVAVGRAMYVRFERNGG